MPPTPETALSRQSWSALVAHALLLGGAGAAVFLAGRADQGNLGVFLLCAGTALVACPPRVRVEGSLWAAAGGLVACMLLAFLPARSISAPAWRRAMEAAPAIALPTSITPWPAATAFWLALLILSLVVGLFALSQPVRARWILRFALGAVLMCAVYAAVSMTAKVMGWGYPFSGGEAFGFLPNRNHTATLLITGVVLAVGVMGVAFRDRRWIVADLAVAGTVPCLAGLFFFSTSRAGVLILLAGVALWVAGLGGRHRPGRLLAATGLAALAALALFLAFPSPARERLLDMAGVRTGEKHGGESDARADTVAQSRVGRRPACSGGTAVGVSAGGVPGYPVVDPRATVDGVGAGHVRGGVRAVPAGVALGIQRAAPRKRLADARGGSRVARVRVGGAARGIGRATARRAADASVLATALGVRGGGRSGVAAQRGGRARAPRGAGVVGACAGGLGVAEAGGRRQAGRGGRRETCY